MRSKQIFDGYILYENGECFSLLSNKMKKWTLNNSGYYVCIFTVNGKQKMFYQHHLMYSEFIGPIEKGYDICHNDGARTNNDLSNLRMDTRKNNMSDKWKHGTRQINEVHGGCKYSSDLVLKILNDFKNGMRVNAIARKYKMKHQTISEYTRGESRQWAR